MQEALSQVPLSGIATLLSALLSFTQPFLLVFENKPAVSIASKPGADERDCKVGCVHQVLHEGVYRACAASCVSL